MAQDVVSQSRDRPDSEDSRPGEIAARPTYEVVEVTPEMLLAGVTELEETCLGTLLEDIANNLYTMLELRPRAMSSQ